MQFRSWISILFLNLLVLSFSACSKNTNTAANGSGGPALQPMPAGPNSPIAPFSIKKVIVVPEDNKIFEAGKQFSLTYSVPDVLQANRPSSLLSVQLKLREILLAAGETPEKWANAKLTTLSWVWTLDKNISQSALNKLVIADKSIIGIGDYVEAKPNSVNDPYYAQQDYLKQIGWEESRDFFDAQLGESKAKIAIIDSGIRFHKDIDSQLFDLTTLGLDFLRGDNDPDDENGHGTAIASLLGATTDNGISIAGIAPKHFKFIPIKVADKAGLTNNVLVYNAIVRAVNMGADVVNLSLSGLSEGCNPGYGDLFLRAGEKGVFFVLAAGNGIPDATKTPVGIRLRRATNFSTADFGLTFSPACWGPLYNNVLTVGALKTNTEKLAAFSNYGSSIELAAPGTGIVSYGLNDDPQGFNGTSFSAPQVTAALALTIAFHKEKGFKYTMPQLEGLMLNSAMQSEVLSNAPRSVYKGRILNLKSLANYLAAYASKDEETRRREPTEDRQTGDGQKPQDLLAPAPIEKFTLQVENQDLFEGDKTQLKAIAVFASTRESKDVSRDVLWTTTDSSLASIDDDGKIGIQKVGVKEKTTLIIEAHYSDPNHRESDEVTATTTILVHPLKEKPDSEQLTSIQLEAQGPITWGSTQNTFKVLGNFEGLRSGLSYSENRDLTTLSKITSNVPGEFRQTAAAGVFDSQEAFGGKTYTLTANFQDLSATLPVTIPKVQVQGITLLNPLGTPVTRGQKMSFTAQLIGADGASKSPITVIWKLDGQTVAKEPTVTLDLDTTNLTVGDHTLMVSGSFKGQGADSSLNQSLTFTLTEKIDHIQIADELPIIKTDNRSTYRLLVFYPNNQFEVVKAGVRWVTNNPSELPIDATTGDVFPAPAAANKSYTVSALYMGNTYSKNISVVSGSQLTGSQSKLLRVEMQRTDPSKPIRGSFSGSNDYVKVQAVYSDGLTRPIQSASSFATDYSKELIAIAGGTLAADFAYGGKTYKVQALYNDGNLDGGTGQVTMDYTIPKSTCTNFAPYFNTMNVTPAMAGLGSTTLKQGGDLYIWAYCYTGDPKGKYSVEGTLGTTFTISGPNFHYAGTYVQGVHTMDLRQLPPGVYTVRIESNFRGQGIDETKVGEALLTIEEVKLSKITLTFRTQGGWSNSTVLKKHGNQAAQVSIVGTYEGGQTRNLKSPEAQLFVTDTEGNRVPNAWAVPFSDFFFVQLFTDSFAKRYRIKGKHIASGIESPELEITSDGALEFPGDSHTGNMPPDIPPAVGASDDNDYCNRDRSAATPFADGTGKESDPFTICTLDQFRRINNLDQINPDIKSLVRVAFELKKNLDFSGIRMQPVAPQKCVSFNGQGHELSNVIIIDGENPDQGVFRLHGMSCSGATRRHQFFNLGIRNPTIRASNWAGALYGTSNDEMFIRGVYVVNGVIQSNKDGAGGMAGYFYNGEMVESYAYGTQVYFGGRMAGGLLGVLGRARIDRSYATGDVQSLGAQGSLSEAGGLIGTVYGSQHYFSVKSNLSDPTPTLSDYPSVVRDCYAKGNILMGHSNTGSLTGGLIGQNSGGMVIRSKAYGHVVATGSTVGGLIGQNQGFSGFDFTGLVYDSHSYGTVYGGLNQKIPGSSNSPDSGGISAVGGLIGESRLAIIQDSTSNGRVSGINTVGGLVGFSNTFNQYIRCQSKATVGSGQAPAGGFMGKKENAYDAKAPDYTYDRMQDNSFMGSLAPGLPAIGQAKDEASKNPVGIVSK